MGDELNRKVRDWAYAKRGHRVYWHNNAGRAAGKGECWDLAEEALAKSGAKTSNDLGVITPDSDYVWGDQIGDVRQVIPGDIIQFRDHKVTTKTVTRVTFQDGTWRSQEQEVFAIRGPQHTAIVNSKMAKDGSIQILEQHVRPSPVVRLNRIYLTEANPPQPPKKAELQKNPKTGKLESAEVTTTVTISVEGTVWAYRPQGK